MPVDRQGEVVWMDPSKLHDSDNGHFDLRSQHYDGEPVLTYFKGPAAGGWGYGDFYLMDSQYNVFTTVTTGGSLPPHETDFHDAVITDEDTMLVLAYVKTPADLSAVGGPSDGWVHDGVIQEIEIATGQVLFEWHSLDHVPVTDAVLDFTEHAKKQRDEEKSELGTVDNPFDYFHLNSATVDTDGGLLASARHTHAVYKISRDTGDLDWILGGVSSDFDLAEDAVFAWQHTAARDTDGTITLFDNHARNADDDRSSRGLRLALDEEAMTASVVTQYLPPADRPAGSMANTQPLADGGMFIGWGQQPFFSAFTRDGELLFDVCHGQACHAEAGGGGGSYRAYLGDWEGHPTTIPDVVVEDATVYVSWNGATEVAQWRVLAGADEARAAEIAVVDKTGFETAIPLPEQIQDGPAGYLAVEAVDDTGAVLATATP